MGRPIVPGTGVSRLMTVSVLSIILVVAALAGPAVASAQQLGETLGQREGIGLISPSGVQNLDNGKNDNSKNDNGKTGNGKTDNGTPVAGQSPATGAPGCAKGNDQKNGQTATAPGCNKGDQDKAKADQDKAKADQDKAKADQDKAKADLANAKTDQDKVKARREKADADEEKANADEAKCNADEAKAIIDLDLAKTDQDRANAKQEKADADRERVDADREKADADIEKAMADLEVATTNRDRADADVEKANADEEKANIDEAKAKADLDRATTDADRAKAKQEKDDADREKANADREKAAVAADFRCGGGPGDLRGEHEDNLCAKPRRAPQGAGQIIVLTATTPGVTVQSPVSAILAAQFAAGTATLPAGQAITIVASPAGALSPQAAAGGAAVTLLPGAVFTVNNQPNLGQIQVQSAGEVVLGVSATALLPATVTSLPKAGGPSVPLGALAGGGLLVASLGVLIRRRIKD